MNDVIGFDERIEKLMPLQLQGILLSKLRRPLTIVLVLGFFARSRPRTTTSTSTIRKFPRVNRQTRALSLGGGSYRNKLSSNGLNYCDGL
jgi:hypothetical protein